MRIVSENSEGDLARREASDQFEWRLRELAANLLRITRGAGKAHDVMPQMIDLAEAMRGYYTAAGMWPSSYEFAQALNVSNDLEAMQHWSDENRNQECAERRIIRGVLQIVASRLVGQKTQEAAGNSEMYGGINEIERVREEAWKVREKAARDARQAAPGANAAKTRPAKPKARAARPRRPA